MKFDFKLNTDAPGQHMVILAMAGVFIFLSVVEAIKSPDQEESELINKGSLLETGETRYRNPELTWYERYFCRGYQRSLFCSWKVLHPLTPVFEKHGVFIEARPPKKDGVTLKKDRSRVPYHSVPLEADSIGDPMAAKGVVHSRNHLPKNRAFTRKLTLND